MTTVDSFWKKTAENDIKTFKKQWALFCLGANKEEFCERNFQHCYQHMARALPLVVVYNFKQQQQQSLHPRPLQTPPNPSSSSPQGTCQNQSQTFSSTCRQSKLELRKMIDYERLIMSSEYQVIKTWIRHDFFAGGWFSRIKNATIIVTFCRVFFSITSKWPFHAKSQNPKLYKKNSTNRPIGWKGLLIQILTYLFIMIKRRLSVIFGAVWLFEKNFNFPVIILCFFSQKFG